MSGCQFAEFFFEAPQTIVVRCMAAHGLNELEAALQQCSNGSAEHRLALADVLGPKPPLDVSGDTIVCSPGPAIPCTNRPGAFDRCRGAYPSGRAGRLAGSAMLH